MRPRPQIIAHRGASAVAPENTLSAYRLAFEQGADAIEGDFRLTRDGHVVCVHDADLRRFGSPLVVAASTLAELRAIDIGAWKSPQYAGERVATLAEVLSLVPPGKHLRLEIKDKSANLPAILDEIQRIGLPPDRVRPMAFDAEVVRLAKQRLPGHAVDWLIEFEIGRPVPTAESVLHTLHAINADGLGVEARPEIVTPAFGRAIVDAGFDLGAWTVNDMTLARSMLAAGVGSITTDRPELFVGNFDPASASLRR